MTRLALVAGVLTLCLSHPPVDAAGADVFGLWVHQTALVSADTIDRLVREASEDGIMVWSYDSVIDRTRHPPGYLAQIGLALATLHTP